MYRLSIDVFEKEIVMSRISVDCYSNIGYNPLENFLLSQPLCNCIGSD